MAGRLGAAVNGQVVVRARARAQGGEAGLGGLLLGVLQARARGQQEWAQETEANSAHPGKEDEEGDDGLSEVGDQSDERERVDPDHLAVQPLRRQAIDREREDGRAEHEPVRQTDLLQ